MDVGVVREVVERVPQLCDALCLSPSRYDVDYGLPVLVMSLVVIVSAPGWLIWRAARGNRCTLRQSIWALACLGGLGLGSALLGVGMVLADPLWQLLGVVTAAGALWGSYAFAKKFLTGRHRFDMGGYMWPASPHDVDGES